MSFKDHDLVSTFDFEGVLYEKRPIYDPTGDVIEGLHAIQITLNNPEQYNSYTTEMVKGVIMGMRRASNDRACVAVVFTGAGNKAFWMRIAGGQEIGMACDFTVAQDLALLGQAGPRHGSAPDGGSTDFLPLFIGIEAAMESCTLCEHWSAHKAYRMGLLTKVVPALKVDGEFVPNPLVVTDRWVDDMGQIVYGERRGGEEKAKAKELMKTGEVDLSLLDKAVDSLITSLAQTMPGCLSKTIESVRKHKLAQWDKNRETNRAWLGLNMMTEGRAGFRAFNEGSRECREADFILLRRRMAEGAKWGDELTEEILAKAHGREPAEQ